jgi:hypothetical protein
MSQLMIRILMIAAVSLLTGCLTLKPNTRADGAVFLELPLDKPPASPAQNQGL